MQTIEQLLERLQAAIVRERRFTDSAAHELRTPLTGVKTHIQVAILASERPDESATLNAALAKADQGVQQLQNILQRLLELARLEGHPAEGESGSLPDALYAAVDAIRLLHGDGASRVQLQVAEASCSVGVAHSLLVAAIQNLIDNAIRYTPAQTPIIVRVRQEGDRFMHISVLDEGPGLSEQERLDAVNRFWRGDMKVPGYGLGLSIVSAIARRHGGALELMSRNGPGLEARLALPIARTSPIP